MPTFVVEARCKNNQKCVEICPSDIMQMDPDINKAYNVEPDMCWECLSCVKACPERAIEVRPYADISPLGSEISVVRDDKANTIKWDIKYRDSRKKQFEFQIRTTPWDSIAVNPVTSKDNISLDDQELSREPEMLLTGKELPKPNALNLKAGAV